MKKSVRLISILMAMLLCLSCMTTGVWAEYADYSSPAGLNALDHPVISVYQCGSMLLDKVDVMLAEKDIHGKIGYGINFSYDLRNIDGALQTIRNVVDHYIWSVKTSWVGDIRRLNFDSLLASPFRTSVGSTDLQILYAIFGFLRDNSERIGKLIDGEWDNGSVVGIFLDLNEKIGDVHQIVKEKLYDALFKDNPDVNVKNTDTIDDMINEYLYVYIGGSEAILPSLEAEMVKGGAMSAPGVKNFKLGNISVYQLIRFFLRAALTDFAKPALTKVLDGNTDMILPLLTGLLGVTAPEGLEGEELVEYLVDDLLDLRNGALSKFISVTDEGISLTTDFQTLLQSLLETAQGLMGGLTAYDTVEKWSDEEISTKLDDQPKMLAYLLRTVLTSLIDYMDIPKTMPVRNETTGRVKEEPINGYALATYTLINIMADKMPEVDYYAMIENYKKGTSGRKLNPGLVPQTKYEEPAAFTVLADYMYYYLNAKTTMSIPSGLTFDETLQWIFNWIISQFGGLLRTNNLDLKTSPTPQNMVVWKNMDILLWNNVLNITWLPDDYVASFKDSNGNYTGNVTRSLLLDNLLYTIVNLDMSQLNNVLSLFNTYQGTISGYPSKAEGELNQNVIKFVLTLFKRLLNGMFQSDSVMFAGTNINCLEDIVSKERYNGKTNLRWMAENMSNLIAQYGEPILTSALPLVAKSLANLDEYAENYDIYPPVATGYGIVDLRNRLAAQQPSNELNDNMMTDENYFFFGGEDFDKNNLYKFYNWRKVYRQATSLSEDFEETLAKLTNELAAIPAAEAEKRAAKQNQITELHREVEVLTYRLDYYYGQLVYRTVNDSQLQREYDQAKKKYGYGTYGSPTSLNGTKNKSTDFTRKTWNDYNEALNFAKRVLNKVANTVPSDPDYIHQSMITAARELLIVRQKELKFFSGAADYSELLKIIQMSQARVDESISDPEAYDLTTISQLVEALQEANSVNTGYDSSDQEIIDEAVTALQAAYDNVSENPQVAKAIGSTTVLDKSNMFIYGMREKLTDFLSYVRNRGVGDLAVTLTGVGKGTGTGAKIGLRLEMNGEVFQNYTVIIFGDVDGDCLADGTDANWIYMYKAGMIKTSIPEYVLDAADANGDGVVDYVDAYYLRMSGIQKYTVDQRGVAA